MTWSGTNVAYAALLPQGGSGQISTRSPGDRARDCDELVTNPTGQINGGLQIIDIAVNIPEPTTLAALSGAAMLVSRRRRA